MYFFRKIFKKVVKIQNSVIFITSILLVAFASYLVVEVESETFPTYFDGFWWVMTTVTTVGYGDYYPISFAGRIIALFLYIFGIGLIGVVIGKVVDGLASFRKKREEGDIVYKEKGHYIIIGWSQKAEFAIKEMLDTNKEIEIVIIDHLDKAPMLGGNIHYIRGHASERETLLKANIKEAEAVLVFADDKINDDQLADGKTLLLASAIESIAPDVHTIVEVMEENHIQNFEYMKVDEFIISNETISSLFVRSAFRKGISNVYSQLLSRSHGDDLYHIPLSSNWKTYGDAFHDLLEQGATLVSDRSNLSINRMLHVEIASDAELYAICDKETYQKIMTKA
ncbi:ion channel [Aquibacillus koreensis]|uniref:Ion channel n=1 Tax=Aquibacillus koreensis TaxID=279446 RepID=A0A9X4AGV3_9BACI|nr:potassium channel family protein [Aquibacillus koreensis]MCT2535034.1 ion channel [Aquibacillus koreensis]MDC3419321.1 ion channel [Aquibacillus koreensis]